MEAGEIRNILARHELLRDRVWGVFARDRLPAHLEPGGYIVNSDIEAGGGEHWMALWVTDQEVEFMDSFAEEPEYYGLTFLFPMLMNSRQLQSDNAVTCGAFSLYFLFFRSLGLSMETILSFFSSNTHANDSHVTQFVGML